MTRHLLPACLGYLAVQTTLLVPAFVLAEATLSYVGLGFPDDVPSWGTMLSDAANVAAHDPRAVDAGAGGRDLPGRARDQRAARAVATTPSPTSSRSG